MCKGQGKCRCRLQLACPVMNMSACDKCLQAFRTAGVLSCVSVLSSALSGTQALLQVLWLQGGQGMSVKP